jgi:AraC-like DNA-binding protein
MDAHQHAHHELIMVLDGMLHVEIRGQAIDAGAGEMLWYPAGVVHREQSDQRRPCETLYVAVDWASAPLTWPLWQADTDGRVMQLMRWLMTERESHYPERGRLRESFLRAILAEYNRLATHKEDVLVTRVRGHIRKHLHEPMDLDGLVKVAGLSKYHLVRRYKALTGRTPMEDVRHIRLLAARELLLTTNLPLKEIAPRTGLGDAYRLCRLFRRQFNFTPGSMRRR